MFSSIAAKLLELGYYKILTEAGADYSKKDSSYKDDNLDIATRLMVEQGEGKKLYDKRESIKDRDNKRDLDRVKKIYK